MNVATAGIRKPSWLLGGTILIYRKPTEGKASDRKLSKSKTSLVRSWGVEAKGEA
jgi:hypothetical protein